jgi:hypothetical protein
VIIVCRKAKYNAPLPFPSAQSQEPTSRS